MPGSPVRAFPSSPQRLLPSERHVFLPKTVGPPCTIGELSRSRRRRPLGVLFGPLSSYPAPSHTLPYRRSELRGRSRPRKAGSGGWTEAVRLSRDPWPRGSSRVVRRGGGGGGPGLGDGWGASAKMAAAAVRSARLTAWGGRLRRGLSAGRRAWPGPSPLAAAVAGVALAGTGVAWYHGRVNVAAPEGRLTVLAQVRDRSFSPSPPSSSLLGLPAVESGGCRGRPRLLFRSQR